MHLRHVRPWENRFRGHATPPNNPQVFGQGPSRVWRSPQGPQSRLRQAFVCRVLSDHETTRKQISILAVKQRRNRRWTGWDKHRRPHQVRCSTAKNGRAFPTRQQGSRLPEVSNFKDPYPWIGFWMITAESAALRWICRKQGERNSSLKISKTKKCLDSCKTCVKRRSRSWSQSNQHRDHSSSNLVELGTTTWVTMKQQLT